MKEISILAAPHAKHQVSHQKALSEGFARHGVKTIFTRNHSNTKHVACWGWRKGKSLRSSGHEVLVIERGYLGDRFSWTSLAWNGLNGYGTFPPATDPARFSKHFEMKPWKDGGDYVLILGQVPNDASLKGKNMHPFYERAAKECAEIHGLPVLFRPHPLAHRRGGRRAVCNAEPSTGGLEDALEGAALAVTFNSNSGVDAVLAGVPTIAVDRGSMAWDVTGHSLDEVVRPDRDKWAAELAWKQWTMDEMRKGDALSGLLEVANV